MRQIIRRITGWILVLSMITSMFGQPIPMAYAADGRKTGIIVYNDILFRRKQH